ncbi:MAG: 30S ribosome-binding factor RbfA [Bacteroidales bacterium]|nr:30S ribosome-binding factor RbfA [Bacteroidales bacterium]
METKRQQKISKLLMKELSEIFQREIKSNGNVMISVTKVNVTTDMSYARVYLSIFGPKMEDKKKVVEEVNGMSKGIRKFLGDRVRHQLRIIPELQFFGDDSLDYIENIDHLLKD